MLAANPQNSIFQSVRLLSFLGRRAASHAQVSANRYDRIEPHGLPAFDSAVGAELLVA